MSAKKPRSSPSLSSTKASPSPSPSLKRVREDSGDTKNKSNSNSAKKMSVEPPGKRARTETKTAPLSQRLLELTTPQPRSAADPEEAQLDAPIRFDYDGAADAAVGETRRFLSAPERSKLKGTAPVHAMELAAATYKGQRTSRAKLEDFQTRGESDEDEDNSDDEDDDDMNSDEEEDGEEESDVDEDGGSEVGESDDMEVDSAEGAEMSDEEMSDNGRYDDSDDSESLQLDDSEDDDASAGEVQQDEAEEEDAASRVALTRARDAQSVAATVARAQRVKEQQAHYESALQLRLALQTPLQLVSRLPSPLEPSDASKQLAASVSSLLGSLTALQASMPLPASRVDEAPTQHVLALEEAARYSSEGFASLDSDALWPRLSALSSSVSAATDAVVEAWHAQGLSAAAASLRALNASPIAQVSAALSSEESHKKLTTRAMGDGDVYDDEELFHALLKELMLVGQQSGQEALTDDPIALSQQYLRLRRLRTRQQRKNVDRRASKGRKLRFQPHEKLAVFMAPMPTRYALRESTRTDELFKSLFGSQVKPTEKE